MANSGSNECKASNKYVDLAKEELKKRLFFQLAMDYNCTENDPWLNNYFEKCYMTSSTRRGLRNALDKVLTRTMQQVLPRLDEKKKQKIQLRLTEAHEKTRRLDDQYAKLERLTLDLMTTEQYRSDKAQTTADFMKAASMYHELKSLYDL